MKWLLQIITLGAGLLMAGTALASSQVTPSDITPSDDDEPILTLIQDRERHQRSLREIEREHQLYDVALRHFEGLEGVFTGVRLGAFLQAEGLDEARRIRFIAADEYTIFLTPEEIADKGFLLVTRFDGEPLPADNLGPLLLVVPEEEEAVLAGEVTPTHWMWSIIEMRAR